MSASSEYLPPEYYLEKLVAFDTISHRSNLQLVDWLCEILKKHHLTPHRIVSKDGQKASVFVTIGEPQGDSRNAGIGLSGHTDVVPVKDQPWTSDPFRLRLDDGRLYGRGTADMKGFLACMLASIPYFKNAKRSSPIHLLFSYDEEIGCTGVRPMIEKLGVTLPKPRIVIVGEPTSMRVVDAHKGIRSFITQVQGLEAHSSTPQKGINAIMLAADLITGLAQQAQALQQSEGNHRFDPPYSTVHVGTISGGTAQNIIPRYCQFRWECRLLPGHDGQNILASFEQRCEAHRKTIKKMAPGADIRTRAVHHVPAFGACDNSEAIALALSCSQQTQTFAVSYGTEAGLFERAGCACVVCGPGDIAQAHKPDEYIEKAELEKCMAFLRRLATYELSDKLHPPYPLPA